MDNSNYIDRNNYAFSNQSVKEDPSYLSTENPNSKKVASPQAYNSSMLYMNGAKENIAKGNYSVASTFLKQFGNMSGFEIEPPSKKFGFLKDIKGNMKNLDITSSQYNMSVLQQYMSEANKRGLYEQANKYMELYTSAVNSSITPEASVEVSNYISEMLSKIKYIDRPTSFIDEDIKKIKSIGNKYYLEEKRLEDSVIDNFRKYGNFIDDTNQGMKDIVGGSRDVVIGALSFIPAIMDLAFDAYSLKSGRKNPVRLTEKLIEATGANPNSWSYFAGNFLGLTEGTPLLKGLNFLRKTGNVKEAMDLARKTSNLVPTWVKLNTAVKTLIASKGTHAISSKILDEFDVSEATREAVPNILSAGAGALAYNTEFSVLPFRPKGLGRTASAPKPNGSGNSGESPTNGGGNSPRPNTPFNGGGNSPEFFSDNISEGIAKANKMQKENLDLMNSKLGIEQPEFVKNVNESSARITEVYKKFNKRENLDSNKDYSSEAQAQDARYTTLEREGRAFEGAFIDDNGETSNIENASPTALMNGAENSSKYSLKIMQNGNFETLGRTSDAYADSVKEASIELYDTPNKIDADSIIQTDDNGIYIDSPINKEIVSAFEAVTNPNTSINLGIYDILKMERKFVDIPRIMLNDPDPAIRQLGGYLKLIDFKAVKDDAEYIGQVARANYEDFSKVTKNILFSVLGIDEGKGEGQVDGSMINDDLYKNQLGANFISDLKSKVQSKYNDIYRTADNSIDIMALNNPEYAKDVSMRVDEIADMLDVTGKSEDVNVNPLIYKNILNTMKGSFGISRAEDVSERIKMYMDPNTDPNKFSSPESKRSLGHRYRIVRRAFKQVERKYASDSAKAYTAMEGDYGSFKENIYNRIISLIDEAFKNSMSPENYDAFNTANKEYSDFKKSISKLEDYYDTTRTGEKTWKFLLKNPTRFKDILSNIAGQTVEQGSPISQMRSLIGLDILKPILTIGSEGNVVFDRRITPRDFATGRVSYFKSLMPEANEQMLSDIVIDTQHLYNAQEALRNPSRTAHVIHNLQGDTYGNIPAQMLEKIQSNNVGVFSQIVKNIGKIISKGLRINTLNKFYIVFKSMKNLFETVLKDINDKNALLFLNELFQVIEDNKVKAIFSNQLVPSIRNKK